MPKNRSFKARLSDLPHSLSARTSERRTGRSDKLLSLCWNIPTNVEFGVLGRRTAIVGGRPRGEPKSAISDADRGNPGDPVGGRAVAFLPRRRVCHKGRLMTQDLTSAGCCEMHQWIASVRCVRKRSALRLPLGRRKAGAG